MPTEHERKIIDHLRQTNLDLPRERMDLESVYEMLQGAASDDPAVRVVLQAAALDGWEMARTLANAIRFMNDQRELNSQLIVRVMQLRSRVVMAANEDGISSVFMTAMAMAQMDQFLDDMIRTLGPTMMERGDGD